MELIACQCSGLPAHDHWIANKRPGEMTEAGREEFGAGGKVYEPYRFDPDDVGRLWVDWKAVARALTVEGTGT